MLDLFDKLNTETQSKQKKTKTVLSGRDTETENIKKELRSGRDSNRTTHQKRIKQRGHREQRGMDSWTWEDILDGKGSNTWEEILAGRDRLPWEQVEAVRRAEAAGKGSQRFEGSRLARKPERQAQKCIGGGTRECG
jgi:hypothetical protein